MKTQPSPDLVLGSKCQAAKERDSTNRQRHTPDLWASFTQLTQLLRTEGSALNYDDSSSQAENSVCASQAEISMGRWRDTPSSVFRCHDICTGERMTRTVRTMQTRPKEPGQKSMKANEWAKWQLEGDRIEEG